MALFGLALLVHVADKAETEPYGGDDDREDDDLLDGEHGGH